MHPSDHGIHLGYQEGLLICEMDHRALAIQQGYHQGLLIPMFVPLLSNMDIMRPP